MTAWRAAPDVAWTEDADGEDLVVAVRLPDGRPVALPGTSATIWRTLVAHTEPVLIEDLVRELAERTGADAEAIAPTLAPYLEALTTAGVLVAE